jgi:transposase
MYIRKFSTRKNGAMHYYWALVESHRTARGPRQRTVAWLGEMDEAGRLGIRSAAENKKEHQQELFDDVEPVWVETDIRKIRVENVREFGGVWVGLEAMKRLQLAGFFEKALPDGRAAIPWSPMIQAMILLRLVSPSSELHMAEHLYGASALEYLLGIPREKVNDDRLYRALDKLLPHKGELEMFLKERLGTLFKLDYDLLLYDVTSTYFEGEAEGNQLAARGYSRDRRPDCKQVCIGLVVARGGMPLGYEVFAGNRSDVTTLDEIIETMEGRYGTANRIWVLDRGMISEENMDYLRAGGRRYIVGTPRGMLKRFERELLSGAWESVRDGLEVKRCASPDGRETYIVCRSRDRREKEKAMHERFERRIEEGLKHIAASCAKRRYNVVTIAKRLGRLLGKNSRAAGLFKTDVIAGADGGAQLVWSKAEAWRDWATLSEGCYLLRSNVNDWSGEDLWQAYMQLTEAEAAFRIHKSDLRIRPIWHQKTERVEAHILVCFLAYVAWKTLAGMCRQAGLGDEPRKVIEELCGIKSVDVVVPTKTGTEIKINCVSRPTPHQEILLRKLKLTLPRRAKAYNVDNL